MTRPRAAWILLGLLGSVMLIPAVAPAYEERPVENGGTLTGRVRFRGPIPAAYVIRVTKDSAVFGQTVPDERLLISKDGTVANVVITIGGIERGKPWPPLKPRVVNHGGRFVPHVQVARTGSRLAVVNRDPVLHNTHGFQGGRSTFNVALPRYRRDRPVFEPLAEPGILEVMCDVHDWMNGWVAVLAHPYFALTGAAGTYTITDIPPGTYTVTAWHEQLGKQQARVTIPPTGRARLDFTFTPPSTP
ncbi:MAG: carboxypeptidase regulatory-like domain-containing protein [Candidatus Methylomirabilales bacterium]